MRTLLVHTVSRRVTGPRFFSTFPTVNTGHPIEKIPDLTRTMPTQANPMSADVTQNNPSTNHEMNPKPPVPEKKTYKILSIDGGGIRGILPARLLSEIEKRTGKPIAETFDLIAGTSTGGVLALGLTAPKKIEAPNGEKTYSADFPQYRASELLELYLRRGKHIFIDSFYAYPTWAHAAGGLLYAGLAAFIINDPTSAFIFGGLLASSKEKNFHVVGGISALSSILLVHYPVFMDFPREIFFNFIGGYFFMKYTFEKFFRPLFETKYLGFGLYNILNTYFEDRLLSQAIKPVLVTSYNLTEHQAAFFMKGKTSPSSQTDYLMSQAVAATASAPSYLDPISIDGKHYVDGGVVANNPTLCAILTAINAGIKIEDIYVVSLGTGLRKQRQYNFAEKGLSYFATKLPTFLLDTQMRLVEKQLELLLSKSNYHRLNVPLSRTVGLDAVTDKNIHYLLYAAEEYIQQNSERIDTLCKTLKLDDLDTKEGDQLKFKLAENYDMTMTQTRALTARNVKWTFITVSVLLFLTYNYYAFYEEEEKRIELIRKPAQQKDYKTALEIIENLTKETLMAPTPFYKILTARRGIMGLTVIIREAAAQGDFEEAQSFLNKLHSLIEEQNGHFQAYEVSSSTFLATEAAKKAQYDATITALNTYKGTHYRRNTALRDAIKTANKNNDFKAAKEIESKCKISH